MWWRVNPLQRVKQGSRALLSAGGGQGGCCARELICPRASKATTMPPSACFQYASPTLPPQKTHNHYSILHSHKAPFYLFVFVIVWLILTCLCDSTGVHTSIERRKNRSVCCRLVKRKKGLPLFLPSGQASV